MPFKAKAKSRHHIPRQKRRITNWPEYDASLKRRGDLLVWVSEDVIAGWKAQPRTTPGGQPVYSPLAIQTALSLRAVFRMPLRQTEGLLGSILSLLDLALDVPDHTTLSRRGKSLMPWQLHRCSTKSMNRSRHFSAMEHMIEKA